MDMKSWLVRYRLPLLLCGTAIVVCLPLAGLAAVQGQTPEQPSASSSAVVSDTRESSEGEVSLAAYRIGEWEGRLAVYIAGSASPDEVFDVYISTLPPEEQERLKAGIDVADDVELARLLEDYTS